MGFLKIYLPQDGFASDLSHTLLFYPIPPFLIIYAKGGISASQLFTKQERGGLSWK
jgi:hypothetical protein